MFGLLSFLVVVNVTLQMVKAHMHGRHIGTDADIHRQRWPEYLNNGQQVGHGLTLVFWRRNGDQSCYAYDDLLDQLQGSGWNAKE